MEVGEWHLRGGYKKGVAGIATVVGDLEEVLFEFRELSGPLQCRPSNDERERALGVSVFGVVEVEEGSGDGRGTFLATQMSTYSTYPQIT